MVVIGGMRSFLGPALGALFYIAFRDYLSSVTENWLLYFGLLFVGFIIFSPTGLVGVAERLLRPFRKTVTLDAAMSARQAGATTLPDFLKPDIHGNGAVLAVSDIAKSFGGIRAVRGVSFAVKDRTLHALIGPNGAGKTTAFNLISGMFTPDAGHVKLAGRAIGGLSPEAITRAGIGRSFQITNLFLASSIEENVRLSCQARDAKRFNIWTPAAGLDNVNQRNRRGALDHGPRRRREGRGRLAVLRRPAPARHGAGARHQAARAAARRAARGPRRRRARARRPPDQADLGRHPGAAGRARHRPRIPARRPRHGDERRPGAGRRHGRGRALFAEGAGGLHRLGRARARREVAADRRQGHDPAAARRRQHLLRQEPHPARRVVRRARERDRGAARPQRRRQVDGAENHHRHRPASVQALSRSTATTSPAIRRRRSRGAASPTCRRAAACSPA